MNGQLGGHSDRRIIRTPQTMPQTQPTKGSKSCKTPISKFALSPDIAPMIIIPRPKIRQFRMPKMRYMDLSFALGGVGTSKLVRRLIIVSQRLIFLTDRHTDATAKP